jgi:thymidylate synthase (FAD)
VLQPDDNKRFLDGLVAPTIFAVARPAIDWNGIADFEKQEAVWRRDPDAAEADLLVELAGRLCYLSFGDLQSPKSNAEYVANLIKQGHHSVLEHASWTLILTGVTRAFTHQLVRHRVGFSFSQLSQQYHTEETARFIEPSSVARDPERQLAWRAAVLQSHKAYVALISSARDNHTGNDQLSGRELRRAYRSAARSLLPAAIETKIALTANARAIRHFLSLRGGIEGDEEMRIVSARILQIVQDDAPALFADFRLERMADGSPVLRQETVR